MTPKSRAQLEKMLATFAQAGGPEHWDVGALDHTSGQMLLREDWDRAQIERATRWIAGRNARGSSIYIRPARSLDAHPWVLVDDLDAHALEDVRTEYPPGIIVETSPGSFQAWCRLARAVPTEIRTTVARTLMQRYAGDPGGVGGVQFGRMPGTTNQKPDRRSSGRAPFAVLRHAGTKIAKNIEIPNSAEPAPGNAAQTHSPRRAGTDQSASDFALACRLIEAGHDDEDVASRVQAARRRLGDAKAERADYIDRTIAAARRRVEGAQSP